LRAIQADPDLHLQLIIAGAHLTDDFGDTISEIERDGFKVSDRIDMLLASDKPAAIGKSIGLGMIGFTQCYDSRRPDILLVLGDRFEMHAAALAAVPFKIPIAHVHGGEVTEGAIDDALRHAITKYSHLHFASTEEHAHRIAQLGEQPASIVVSGAPSLDNLRTMKLADRGELEKRLKLSLDTPPLLVTYHPVTLQYEQAEWQIEELLAVLAGRRMPIVITKPNADTSGRLIIRKLEEFAAKRPADVRLEDNLGTAGYFGLMRYAGAMVGNSSSGIIEAASFRLPVVNIGIRQRGRPTSRNVLDCGNRREEIAAALDEALSSEFREGLEGLTNIYGDGRAAERIVERLKALPLDDSTLIKHFYDWRPEQAAAVDA
jgi:UDP-N-acetylglucosamine 2-epimerase (non-hydrolysing)/GDP/UDP-N,N'-diacetylbacillosamine 2-epimerase (hydrolysing)